VSEFWLNGRRVGEHEGGYTSFELEVTGHVKFGEEENVLAMADEMIRRDRNHPCIILRGIA
jgi:beta-galactosidase/beta-glucuronidase